MPLNSIPGEGGRKGEGEGEGEGVGEGEGEGGEGERSSRPTVFTNVFVNHYQKFH